MTPLLTPVSPWGKVYKEQHWHSGIRIPLALEEKIADSKK
jgi:hypothetical protein